MDRNQKALENSPVALGVGNSRKPKIDPKKQTREWIVETRADDFQRRQFSEAIFISRYVSDRVATSDT